MAKRSKKQNHSLREVMTDQDSIISAEKRKARELRKTSWWRKKINSGVCHYCKAVFKPSELTMDHVIPLARGGRSERINLVPSCKECNNEKMYRLPVEWQEYMESLQKKNSN